MRTSSTLQNCGLPKSPMLAGNRQILRQATAATNSLNSSPASSRSTHSTTLNNAAKLRIAASNKPPSIKLQDESPKVTPRLGRRLKDISNTNGNGVAKNLSPLRSPQLIRSTRVDTNNWINSGKMKSSSNTVHSKSPGSGTSVESIVPKYQQSLSNQSCYSNGVAQKRSYNLNNNNNSKVSNKLTNKIVNTRNLCNGNVNGTATLQQTRDVIAATTNGGLTARTSAIINGNHLKNNLNKNVMPMNGVASNNKPILKSTISASSNGSSSSSSTKSFSSKFPNGLPFEDEFYHFRNNQNINTNNMTSNGNHLNGATGLRTNNHHHTQKNNNKNNRSSIASDTSFSNNSSHSDESVTSSNTVRSSYSSYEDEFARKPSSEPLYVDFTLKSKTTSKLSENGVTKTTYKLNNNDNCFCEFESIKNGGLYGDKYNNKLDKQDPVVYVAVASWVPKCNRLPYDDSDILEPTNENVEYVFLKFKLFASLSYILLFWLYQNCKLNFFPGLV